MGLSIAYQLKIKVSVDEARALLARMREFAATLEFDSVSEIVEYDPPDGRRVFAAPAGSHTGNWKPGHRYLTRKREDGLTELVQVPAIHSMSFRAQTSGAETAAFGLATHPAVVVHREDIVTYPDGGGEERRIGAGATVEFPTRLRGWYSWSTACKTQYAARPQLGGIRNFLRAHLSIVQMVDECRKMGMKVKVSDDGNYWKSRSEKKLVAEIQKWDELIAGIVGRITDKFDGDSGVVVAPIRNRPDYEHLEARGADRLDKTASKRRKKGESKK